MSDLLIKAPIEYEPLRKNRFLLRFPSDLGIQEWWVSNAARPTITMKETEIPFLNTSTWVVFLDIPSTMQLTVMAIRSMPDSTIPRIFTEKLFHHSLFLSSFTRCVSIPKVSLL